MKFQKLFFFVLILIGTFMFLLYIMFSKSNYVNKNGNVPMSQHNIETYPPTEITDEPPPIIVVDEFPFDTVSTSLIWNAYHESFCEKYQYSQRLREDLFQKENLNEHDLIDPETIPHDERDRFLDIAFQDLLPEVGENYTSKEAAILDFTENFVYVLFLLPKMPENYQGGGFICWYKIDRKTGKIISIKESV